MTGPVLRWGNSRPEAIRRTSARARSPRANLLLLIVPLFLGCGSEKRPSVQLTLISPHRDEIREEVAHAFTEWFQARTASRCHALRGHVKSWLDRAEKTGMDHVEAAFAGFANDWRSDDL